MPRPMRKTQDKLSDIGEVASWRRRGKIAWGPSPEKRILFLYNRSHYIYENKQKEDTLPDNKGDISYQNTHILQKPPAFLSLFARWERIPRFKMYKLERPLRELSSSMTF